MIKIKTSGMHMALDIFHSTINKQPLRVNIVFGIINTKIRHKPSPQGHSLLKIIDTLAPR